MGARFSLSFGLQISTSAARESQSGLLINSHLQTVAQVDSEQIGFALIRAYLRDLVFGHGGFQPIPSDGDWSF